MPGIFRNTFHRADFHALRRIKMAYAFGTQIRVDLVNLETLVDGLIRTFGLADITIDAFLGDYQCQGQLLVKPNCSLSVSSTSGPTNWETSPPSLATSRTSVDEMNP